MTARKCIICSRPLPSGSSAPVRGDSAGDARTLEAYCVCHAQAYTGLLSHFQAWTEAYGKLSWQEYLSRIIEQNETGSWIREIAEAEMKKVRK